MAKVVSDTARKDFLGFELSGIVTAEDYEKTLIPAVQEKLKSTEKLRVLYHVKEDFDSYELKAMFDDAKAGVEFWNNWEKIAVVSDVSWIIDAVKIFFRNIAGVFLVGMAVLKKPMQHVGGKPFLLFFRGFMGFVALLAFFYNIAHISLGDAMTYSKTSPIFTAIFAWLFLHEKLSVKAWMAVFVGFVGIVFITQPSGFGFSKYDWLGIFSGVGAALAYTSVRELKQYYDTRAIVLSFMGVGTVGPLVLFFISPYVDAPELDFMLAKAYGETKAGIVGAVSYTNIFFSIIVGLFLGDALPSLSTSFGILLIVAAGIMVARDK